ncbi:MAG: hypothetical protein WD556_10255 [Actinomycetota bacterium]
MTRDDEVANEWVGLWRSERKRRVLRLTTWNVAISCIGGVAVGAFVDPWLGAAVALISSIAIEVMLVQFIDHPADGNRKQLFRWYAIAFAIGTTLFLVAFAIMAEVTDG